MMTDISVEVVGTERQTETTITLTSCYVRKTHIQHLFTEIVVCQLMLVAYGHVSFVARVFWEFGAHRAHQMFEHKIG